MDRPFSDGELSVISYTSFQYPESKQQSDLMPGFAETEPFSALPSGFDEQRQQYLPEASSFKVVCHPYQHTPAPHGSDAGAHMTPHPPYQPKNQHVWPSPPPGPGDIQNCASFHDSPVSANIHLPCYTSPDTPEYWPSPASNYPQSATLFQQHHPEAQAYARICTPISATEFPLRKPEMNTPYTGGFYQDSEIETPGMDYSGPSPGMASNLLGVPPSSSAGSPLRADTPTSMDVSKDDTASGAVIASSAAPNSTQQSTADGTKNDEPYAKLIYRAFMSQPDHSMTLQDIYQWFRENTNKTASEKSGWQNSIRHNLSMNAAFTRRDRKQVDGSTSMMEGGSPLACGESRRTNEWVLEDWAVRDGVQSTTRYRKGNSGRRPPRCTSHPNGSVGQRANQHISTKALSGRKGGHAARNSRLRGRQYNQESPMGKAPYHFIEQGFDSPPQSSMPGPYFSPVIPVSRLDPTAIQTPIAHGHDASTSYAPETAVTTEPFGMQMTDPCMGHAAASGGGCHSDIHSMPCVGHHEPMYLIPSPGDFTYTTADAQLDYSGDHCVTEIPDSEPLFDPLPGSWYQHHGLP